MKPDVIAVKDRVLLAQKSILEAMAKLETNSKRSAVTHELMVAYRNLLRAELYCGS